MRNLLIILAILFSSCSAHNDNKHLEAQVDSLNNKLRNSYKPGFGEFMSNIQLHHAKLWFAGSNNNWQLADYEVHEMQEALANIQKYNNDRPESQVVDVVYPSIDSLNNAIKQQNLQLFKSSYNLLTRSCNDCHKSTGHGFNIITIPSLPPVSNQNFKPE
jgi:hypothetical protein